MSRREAIPADVARRDWRALYVAGAVVALVTLAGTLLDIALTMVPGFDPSTVPASASAWLEQLASSPWVGLRNLDLLNVTLSLIGLPMYAALCGAHRRVAPALAVLTLLFAMVGAVVFAASNAALPMMELARSWSAADGAGRQTLVSAAGALLARGAHGSMGALPGFALSEIGTLLVGLMMLRGRVFSRLTGWLAVAGATVLAGYTVAITFTPGSEALMKGVAAPAGIAMMVWYVLVARGLWRLSRTATTGGQTEGATGSLG